MSTTDNKAKEVQTSKPTVEKTSSAKKPAAPKTVAKPNLPENAFSVKVNTQAIFDTILSERASRRQGTHKVKHRGEVRGGGKKPFAQKHTGRARAGSTRSPIWVGGGTVFGPSTERNYNLKVNKKVRKLAFASALTLKAKDNAVVINEFSKMEKPSTKTLVESIKGLNLKEQFKKILIISENEILFKSAANLPKVIVQKLSGLGVEQIVNADVMIINNEDLKKLEGMVK